MMHEKNYQKICDVYDFFDVKMLDFVKNDLKVEPSLRRRAWEFASIFLALQQAGKLDGNHIGLGMGVGTERLIYALAPYVKRAILTDLYQTDSRWVAVRTEDPNVMLKERAPWEVDWSKLQAARMDMRALDLGDQEVDFAWSTGAIEHIGTDTDFINHFNEVYRVLKPGGIYVFTTAIVFGNETIRFPNNYLFNPQHLLDLISKSKLHAAPVFDCSIKPHSLNKPAFEDLTEFGLNIPRQATPHIVSFRRGVVTTANCMILTKEPSGSKSSVIVGFDNTKSEMIRSATSLVKTIWDNTQNINVSDIHNDAVSPMMYFGKGHMEIIAEGDAGAVRIISRSRGLSEKSQVVKKALLVNGTVKIDFTSNEDCIYKIIFPGASGKKVHLSARKLRAHKK